MFSLFDFKPKLLHDISLMFYVSRWLMSLSSLLMLTIHHHAAFLGTLHIGGQQGRAIQLCLAVSQKWFNLHLTFTWSTLSSSKYMTGRDILKISMKLHRICKLWREKMYLKNVFYLKQHWNVWIFPIVNLMFCDKQYGLIFLSFESVKHNGKFIVK